MINKVKNGNDYISLQKNELENLKNYTSQQKLFSQVAKIVHNEISQIKGWDLSTDKIERYNNLRKKLQIASKIFKKKYPECLPIPIHMIQGIDQDKQTDDIEKDCDYAFHIGYNTVVNWMKIVQPLKMNIENAWEKLLKTHQSAQKVQFQKQQDIQRKILFKLKGYCFSNGMEKSFKINYQKILRGEQIDELNNPEQNLILSLQNIEQLLKEVNKNIENS